MHSTLVLSADELRELIAAVAEYNGKSVQTVDFVCTDAGLQEAVIVSAVPGLLVRTSSEGESPEDVARSFSERSVNPDVSAVG
jgi:hypothetical protein